ncbi:hypothetical protein [Murimonas intestini]|uniref:hypothetical protein n=1 Tax=Murimonas intestini TaxID=1337051 RepID=UPI00214BEB71|nr:hypothetical protein [Murimonas intestini]MCR1842110.1 hypothetical protein [Murimonas intestini]
MAYEEFLYNNWNRKEDYADEIRMPHFEEVDGYVMDAFKEKYRNVQILKKMFEEFRCDH